MKRSLQIDNWRIHREFAWYGLQRNSKGSTPFLCDGGGGTACVFHGRVSFLRQPSGSNSLRRYKTTHTCLLLICPHASVLLFVIMTLYLSISPAAVLTLTRYSLSPFLYESVLTVLSSLLLLHHQIKLDGKPVTYTQVSLSIGTYELCELIDGV